MKNGTLKCYLCDTEAVQNFHPGKRTYTVECPHCVNEYEITMEALKCYFGRDEENKVLTREERYSFSKLVQSQSIIITAKLVAEKTGKPH